MKAFHWLKNMPYKPKKINYLLIFIYLAYKPDLLFQIIRLKTENNLDSFTREIS